MKLKSFEKVRTATCTEYVVFHEQRVVDAFTVDYIAKTKDGDYDTAGTTAAIIKRMHYEDTGAKVISVDTNSVNGHLYVTIEI